MGDQPLGAKVLVPVGLMITSGVVGQFPTLTDTRPYRSREPLLISKLLCPSNVIPEVVVILDSIVNSYPAKPSTCPCVSVESKLSILAWDSSRKVTQGGSKEAN
ncbi:hypothetical protein AFLA_007329 [Aspergillus flavus NRRL3357]|nr:hypothetical protein AFLA_007329 [Aspergillus flavus NRRL3357]